MARILFTVLPEKGHVNPAIGPALHLQATGHTVAFYADHDISDQLGRAGLPRFVGSLRRASPANRGAELAACIRDADWLRHWIKRLLVDEVPGQIEEIERALVDFRPDVIATDPMLYAAAIVAENNGLPWAAISNSLNPVLPEGLDSDLLRTVRWLSPDRQALFARHGLAPSFSGCDLVSPYLTVAFTTSTFTGAAVEGVHQVGPSLPPGERGDESDFPWQKLDPELPLVYVSLGSQIYHQPRIFRTICDAVRDRPVQCVLSVSDLLGSPELGVLPPNTIAVRYAPQLALLKRAAVMITHGGANSVMEALAFGVPLLITPLRNDQFHQAHFVERRRVGQALDLAAASAAECWQAIEALLGPAPFRKAAQCVSESYRESDGAATTARLLTALARRAIDREEE